MKILLPLFIIISLLIGKLIGSVSAWMIIPP